MRVSPSKTMNESFAYFLGVLHDAHIICREKVCQYGFEIEQKNKEYALYLSSLINELFSLNTMLEVRKRKWGTYYRIRVYSKKIYEEIMKYDFKKCLAKEPKRIKRCLIQGFFDAEGSVTVNEVRMFNKDVELLEAVRAVLSKEFGIKCAKIVRSNGDVMQLPIYAKQEKYKFLNQIGSTHPEKRSLREKKRVKKT